MPINYPNIKAEWDEGTLVSFWREPKVGGRVLASTRQLMEKLHIPCLTDSREKTLWINCIVPKPKTSQTKPWKQLKEGTWKPVSSVAHLVYTQQALQADFAPSSPTVKPAVTSALPRHQRGCAHHPGAPALPRWQTSQQELRAWLHLTALMDTGHKDNNSFSVQISSTVKLSP